MPVILAIPAGALQIISSDRILWGADFNSAAGIYGASEFVRRCLAEVLAEKVERGDLIEEHAMKIGRQILRDSAWKLFPQLADRLWKHKGPLAAPAAEPLAAKAARFLVD